MTSLTVVTSTQPQFTLSSNFDLSMLTPEQKMQVLVTVNQFRAARSRVAIEVLYMTEQLVLLEGYLGDKFMAFATAELQVSARTIRRYLLANRQLRTYFSNDGMIDFQTASMFSQQALSLLSPELDVNVIDELKVLAQNGTSINESTIQDLLDKQNKNESQLQDALADAAQASADADAAAKELEEERAALVKMKEKMDKSETLTAEIMRRLTDTRDAAIEELEKVRAQADITATVEVEVVPAGYASKVEAINAVNDALAKVNLNKEKAEKQHADILARIKELDAGADEFFKFQQQATDLISKYPAARLQAITGTDPKLKLAVAGLGHAFLELGNSISAACAA